ncbi:YitT family protein [Lachnospiraceae bacterium 46-61]
MMLHTIRTFAARYIMITIGILLVSIGLEVFLIPNHIIDGGITGISIMFSYLTNIPLNVIVVILNLPFMFVSLKQMGKRFAIGYLYAMIALSIGLMIAGNLERITHDTLLATLFGGVLLGIGVGLVIRYGACMDGTEMAAILISKKTDMSVGQFVLICNLFIFTVATFIFGFDRAMYSLVAYFVASKLIDTVVEGSNQVKAALIVTQHEQEVSQAILKCLGRTVTIMEGEGMFSGKKGILYVVLTRVEVTELRTVIEQVDIKTQSPSFVTILDVSEVMGNNLMKYGKQKNKGLSRIL